MRTSAAILLLCVLLGSAQTSTAQTANRLAPAAPTPQPLDSAGLRAIFNDLFCARSINDTAYVSSDRLIKSHLPEAGNPYLWAGLAAIRLRFAEFSNRAADEAMPINESAENATRTGPTAWDAWWTLALVRIHQRRYPEAKVLIAKSLKLGAPVSATAWARAELAFRIQDVKGAESALRGAIGGDESKYIPDSFLQLRLADALRRQGRADEALAVFKTAEHGLLSLRSPCLFLSRYGQAQTMLLYKGDSATAAPLIEAGAAVAGAGGFGELRSLLYYVALKDNLSLGKPILSADEAALELVKYPVGAVVLPAMMRAGKLRNADIVDGKGNSLLMLAAMANQHDTAAFLIKAGAKVDRANPQGRRALDMFCALGSEAGVRLLLGAKAQINYRDLNSSTPLGAAIASGNAAIVKLILSGIKKVDKADLDRFVVQSAYFGMTEIVKALVAHGAAINESDKARMPILIAAVISGNRELVAWLLERKADARASFMGRSAVDFARDSDDPLMIQLVIGSKVRDT